MLLVYNIRQHLAGTTKSLTCQFHQQWTSTPLMSKKVNAKFLYHVSLGIDFLDFEGAAMVDQPELTGTSTNDNDDGINNVIDLVNIDFKMEPKLLQLKFPGADEGI